MKADATIRDNLARTRVTRAGADSGQQETCHDITAQAAYS
jgi:uncharacterized protein YheU (UPF0270 family)